MWSGRACSGRAHLEVFHRFVLALEARHQLLDQHLPAVQKAAVGGQKGGCKVIGCRTWLAEVRLDLEQYGHGGHDEQGHAELVQG